MRRGEAAVEGSVGTILHTRTEGSGWAHSRLRADPVDQAVTATRAEQEQQHPPTPASLRGA